EGPVERPVRVFVWTCEDLTPRHPHGGTSRDGWAGPSALHREALGTFAASSPVSPLGVGSRRSPMNTGRALVGIGLLAIGLLILLEQVGVLDAGEVIADWWPVLFVVQALLELIARPARPIGAAVFA